MNLITTPNFNLINQVAWRVLNLLIERKAMLHPAGTVFYTWQRADRIVIAFDPSTIDVKRVNEDFAHALSTRLHGRRVVFTNSRGLFMQVGFEIPAAPRPLESKPLDLSQQPTPYHVPVGMTQSGPLWISIIDGDSCLIGGSRGNGKTGEEHGWIQALLHGNKTEVYAWDGKRGAEFGRYVGHPKFHLMFNADELENLRLLLSSRESLLAWSGYPNIIMHNQAGLEFIPPIALFVDEAADLPDSAKDLLKQMIRLYRHAGLYPIIATNQPTQAEVFAKTNLSTRIAFRVPHHTDSITMLGYKGAETLPDLRGRGLIPWRGKFIEFQSFDIEYPMPTEEARHLISERLATKKTDEPLGEIEQLAESIREQWTPGMSKSGVSRLFGKNYAGTSWCRKVDQVIEYLASTTPTSTQGLPMEATAG
jgi:hypothetical protein